MICKKYEIPYRYLIDWKGIAAFRRDTKLQRASMAHTERPLATDTFEASDIKKAIVNAV